MYCTQAYLTTKFAGRFNFGSSGTCLMGTAQAQSIIDTMTNYIDLTCAPVYGTASPLFGTNTWGTTDVPLVIQDICSDLSMGMMFKNTVLTISEKQSIWAEDIYGRGTEWLGKVASNLWVVAGYKGTILTENPIVSGGELEVWGEGVTFSGTNLQQLNNMALVDNSIVVYGTQALNPPVYRRYIDYNYWSYGVAKQGDNVGYIASTGTGSITGTFPVYVDYQYKNLPNFRINDYVKWSLTSRENRG